MKGTRLQVHLGGEWRMLMNVLPKDVRIGILNLWIEIQVNEPLHHVLHYCFMSIKWYNSCEAELTLCGSIKFYSNFKIALCIHMCKCLCVYVSLSILQLNGYLAGFNVHCAVISAAGLLMRSSMHICHIISNSILCIVFQVGHMLCVLCIFLRCALVMCQPWNQSYWQWYRMRDITRYDSK